MQRQTLAISPEQGIGNMTVDIVKPRQRRLVPSVIGLPGVTLRAFGSDIDNPVSLRLEVHIPFFLIIPIDQCDLLKQHSLLSFPLQSGMVIGTIIAV